MIIYDSWSFPGDDSLNGATCSSAVCRCLCWLLQESGQRLTVLEVGCGVGNFMFPLLSETDSIIFHACDFSPRAIQFVKVSIIDHRLH